MMSLIHYKHGREIFLMTRDKVAAELKEKFALALPSCGKSQVTDYILQELEGRQPAIKYVSISDIPAIQQLQQATDQQRLAGSYFARHDDEALMAVNTVVESR